MRGIAFSEDEAMAVVLAVESASYDEYVLRHGDPNWMNPAKARETNMTRRGVGSPAEDPAVMKKILDMFRKNHLGFTSSFQLPGIREKIVNGWQERNTVLTIR